MRHVSRLVAVRTSRTVGGRFVPGRPCGTGSVFARLRGEQTAEVPFSAPPHAMVRWQRPRASRPGGDPRCLGARVLFPRVVAKLLDARAYSRRDPSRPSTARCGRRPWRRSLAASERRVLPCGVRSSFRALHPNRSQAASTCGPVRLRSASWPASRRGKSRAVVPCGCSPTRSPAQRVRFEALGEGSSASLFLAKCGH